MRQGDMKCHGSSARIGNSLVDLKLDHPSRSDYIAEVQTKVSLSSHSQHQTQFWISVWDRACVWVWVCDWVWV